MSAGVEAPLVRQFDLLATAPGGVARLRELVLTLAVQGKLVPQEAGDEPASVLLQRIRAEKDRLIAAGKIKKDKSLPSITEEEKVNDLPGGWEQVRLGSILIRLSNGYTGEQSKFPTNFPLTRIESISKAVLDYTRLGYCTNISATDVEKYRVERGDILLSHINSDIHIGKTAIIDDDKMLIHGTNLLLLRPPKFINSKYLNIAITQRRFDGYFISIAQHAIGQASINQSKLAGTIFSVPPLAEQSRIVTRVEELMRLCDALEQQRQLETAQHAQLLNTLLGTLTDCTSPDELAANWQRVSDHFDLLLDRPEAVDALEQTILQLAVRGLLVPQDPADEPASVLLQRIRAEKDRLIAEGKIKRDKPLQAITDKENTLDLPEGWESVIVANVFDVTSGSTFDAGLEKQSGTYMYVKVGDMNLLGNETEITTSSRFIDPDERMAKALIPSGSIIFPKRGGAIATNKKRLVKEPIFVDLNTMAITPILVLTSYAFIWLTTIDLASLNTGTSVPQINHKDIDPLPFPLPPLAEQTRIVARVTQLRDLCTTLRQRLTAGQTTQRHLAEALVEV